MSAYVLTPLAEDDLGEALEFVAADDPQAALRLLHRFEAAFELLSRHPNAGHRRIDLTRDKRARFWAVAPYLILYLSGPSPLRIVRILRGERDLDALLHGRPTL